MKKDQRLLSAKEEQNLLEGAKYDAYAENISIRERRRLNIWYKIYLSTAILTVVALLLLLFLGVGKNGSLFSPKKIAASISGFFVDLDFFGTQDKTDVVKPDAEVPPLTNSNDKKPSADKEDENEPDRETGATVSDIYYFDHSKVPEGHTPIIPLDLSLSSYGLTYINNATGYSPDTKVLLNKDLKMNGGVEYMSAYEGPTVLIIHTHGTEAYSDNGAISYDSGISDYARSNDISKNVVAVGKTVADILNQKGIATAHCTIMHDSVQYKDSYARAEETVRRYLEEYPTIRLVIDIHRDSVIKSNGEMVRPIALSDDGQPAAQMMCVVGSDWGGDECDGWEDNLSLALKLREKLNDECPNICRPVNLKSSTYNQELAEYSLLVEMGASGNSLEEAQCSAEMLANAVALLLEEI